MSSCADADSNNDSVLPPTVTEGGVGDPLLEGTALGGCSPRAEDDGMRKGLLSADRGTVDDDNEAKDW
jgi:hypothetical protein